MDRVTDTLELPARAIAKLHQDSNGDIRKQELDSITLFSIAISLKRIADAIDGTALGVDINDSIVGLRRDHS